MPPYGASPFPGASQPAPMLRSAVANAHMASCAPRCRRIQEAGPRGVLVSRPGLGVVVLTSVPRLRRGVPLSLLAHDGLQCLHRLFRAVHAAVQLVQTLAQLHHRGQHSAVQLVGTR